MGGSSKKITIGYKYHIGMHLVLCHGPVDSLKKITVDGRTAWQGNVSDGQIQINQPDLFGGETREGGVSGGIDVLSGAPSQGANAYLQSKIEGDVPSFRGVLSLVFKQVYVGLNPYLKKWAFMVSRVSVRQNGIPQWYDEKSGIVTDIPEPVIGGSGWVDRNTGLFYVGAYKAVSGFYSTYNGWFNGYIGGLRATVGVARYAQKHYSVPTALFGDALSDPYWGNVLFQLRMQGSDGSTSFVDDKGHTVTAHGGAQISTAQSPLGGSSGYFNGSDSYLTVNVGADEMLGNSWTIDGWIRLDDHDATPNTYGNAIFSYGVVTTPAYESTLSVFGDSVRFDQQEAASTFSADAFQNIGPRAQIGEWAFVSICFDGARHWLHINGQLVTSPGTWVGMNPSHIIRECLTDPDWGMGYQESDVDDVSFTAAADTLHQEGMGISIVWDRQTTIEDFIKEIEKHIDATLYVDRSTGKFRLKLIRSDYDETSLLRLDENNVAQVANFTRPAFGELINSITVNYWDANRDAEASITVQDIALAQMQGITINTTIQYPGFSSSNIAALVAQRDLKALSTPRISCTIYANAEAASLSLGDVFKFNFPDYEVFDVVMRVTGIAYGDGRTHRVRINAEQDVFSLPSSPVISPSLPEWIDPNEMPAAVQNRIVFEAPYLELVQLEGQSAVDSVIDATPEVGRVGAAGVRPASSAISARMLDDSGAGYVEVGNMDFSPAAELDGAIDEIATTLAIKNGEELEQVLLGTWVQVDNEIMAVTAISSNSISVKRGCLDTVPSKHSDAKPLIFWDNYSTVDDTEFVYGDIVKVKLATVTGKGQLDLLSAPEDTLTIIGRAARPYPPGQVKINGSYFPETITGPVSLSWAHRDRKQQTADLIGFTDGSVGPEAGTTYELRLYGETDTLLRTETGLTGTSYTWADEEADSGLVVPGAAGGDGYWSSRVALLHFGGVDGSTAFVDEKGHTFTAVGNAQIDTAQSLFGGASGLFDGAGDYIWAADSADWDFGTGDFTIQIAVRFNALPSNNSMTLCGTYVGSSSGWSLQFRNDGGVGNRMRFGVVGDTGFDFAWSPATGTWYKIEISRSGTSLRAFVGGTQIGSTQTSGHDISSAAPLWVGGLNSGSGVQWFNGWFDELRITKGRAEHTANYTPDAAPFPGSGPARLNGRIRFELESVRDGLVSFQHHNISVDRTGWGYNWGKYWGGPAP